ncbi:hypothetical protein PUV54_08390 [Hyphococcus flavus]|uniref:Uncharacterized protein n=1 Tax=Hyphococcus flavus TaxID=1866326 RepID=A0AAE9ZHK0_9PROT|nr:hypothetical protein [Hyphococcus flavus]WDI33213.1 hypothetical protein PUV54_08390 [Hyphococcus flavus]
MSAVTTLAATVAAAAGAVALYRFIDKRSKSLSAAISEFKKTSRHNNGTVIEYEQDPESGVYKPKEKFRR